jgi:hypothetical protein
MFALFQITAPQCGSLLRLPKSGLHDYQDDQSLRQRAFRYPIHSPGIMLGLNQSRTPAPQEHLSIGPTNDIAFLDDNFLPISAALSTQNANGWRLLLSL